MRLRPDGSGNLCVTPAENDQGICEVFWVKPPEAAYILGGTVMVRQDRTCYLTFPCLP